MRWVGVLCGAGLSHRWVNCKSFLGADLSFEIATELDHALRVVGMQYDPQLVVRVEAQRLPVSAGCSMETFFCACGGIYNAMRC
eukprot:COSAG06_NODE_53620_length_299_cov_0.740000_1_plen_83_part_01